MRVLGETAKDRSRAAGLASAAAAMKSRRITRVVGLNVGPVSCGQGEVHMVQIQGTAHLVRRLQLFRT